MSAVGLDFCLTGTSCTDSAAQTRHLDSLTRKARQCVFQLCQLNLQLALLALCAQGEDIKDQRCAVNNSDIGFVFYVSYLSGAQLAVNYDQIYFALGANLLDFLQLAAAHKCCGFRLLKLLSDRQYRLRARALYKLKQLVKRRLRVKSACVHADKQRLCYLFFITNHIIHFAFLMSVILMMSVFCEFFTSRT